MKKLIASLLLLCLCFMLGACRQSEDEISEPIDDLRFDIVYHNAISYGNFKTYTYILVDRETNVMYLYVTNNERGGVSVMVDEDGKPMIWKEREGTE